MKRSLLFVCLAAAVAARGDIPGVTFNSLFLTNANPNHVVAGPDGNVWFTDRANRAVGKLVLSGNSGTATLYPIASLLNPGESVNSVGDITVGPDYALWFTYNTCKNSCSIIAGGGLGRVTADGAITLKPISNLTDAASIVTGPDRNLWAVGSTSVARVTLDGTATLFTPPSGNCCSGKIVVGPDHNLWYLEHPGIGRITTDGAITEYTTTIAGPGMTFGSDGNLWFVAAINQLGRMTTEGAVTLFTLPDAQAYPTGITSAPDGNIWFNEHFDNRLGRLTVPPPNATSATVDISAYTPFGRLWNDLILLPASSPAKTAAGPPDSFRLFESNDGSSTMSGTPEIINVSFTPTFGAPLLTISKKHWRDTRAGNDQYHYFLVVTNVGSSPTSGPWQVSDVLPKEITDAHFEQTSSAGIDDCSFDPIARRFLCTINTVLQPDAGLGSSSSHALVLEVSLDAPDGTTITNQAAVSGGGDPITHLSNIDIITLGRASLVVTKNHGKSPVDGRFEWTITVENRGKVPTESPVTVTDPLPTGVTLQPLGSEIGGTCSVSGGKVTCQSTGALGAGQSIHFTLPIDTLPNGDFSNTATASAVGASDTSSGDVLSVRKGFPLANAPPKATHGRRP